MSGGHAAALTVAVLVAGLAAIIWAAPRLEPWHQRRELMRQWRRQLRGLHSGHLDAWKPRGSGREPPPR